MEKVPFQKNDVTELAITDLGSDGEGIGKADGYTLFVKDAVIGDYIRAKIMKTRKNFGYAKLLEVLRPSPYRVRPRCEIAGACGGCQLQALRYDQQLLFKYKKVRSSLIRIGGFDEALTDSVLQPVIGMEDPYRFRNKAQFPIGMKNGEPVAGFYAGRTHSIVPVSDCLIGAAENAVILQTILSYMKEFHVPAYDEITGQGLLRHVLIRRAVYTKQIMVCLIVNAERLPKEEILVQRLQAIPEMTGITLNTNTGRTNVIMGKKLRVLWGKGTIRDVLHVYKVRENAAAASSVATPAGAPDVPPAAADPAGASDVPAAAGMGQMRTAALAFEPAGEEVSFDISPLSFYQVNPAQTEKLYSIALAYAGLTGQENVWDLYCGVGTISLFLARHAKRVYGIEVIPEAIRDAKANAERNHITNAEFTAGRVEDILPDHARSMHTPVDVVVVDPPRKGLDETCIRTVLGAAPKRIVYVSCDPATLARDLKVFAEGGYRLEKVQPVDQFGHSVHIETVCLLSKLSEAKNHISVKVDIDEIDVTAAESKATYEEVQEWVQEKYGFHVTHLNIAKTKRKCGIIERINYNLPKSENSKSPGTPKEKEDAIIDAFKHFQMI